VKVGVGGRLVAVNAGVAVGVGVGGRLVFVGVGLAGTFVLVGMGVGGTFVFVGVGAVAMVKDHQVVLLPLAYVIPAGLLDRTCQ